MIDYDALMKRIDSIQDLPVSEEMLGAYCEGTLNSVDTATVDDFISNDAALGELVDSVDNLQVHDNGFSFDYNGGLSVDNMELPEVPMDNEFTTLGIDIIPNIENFGMVAAVAAGHVFCGISDDFLSGNDDFISGDNDILSTDDHSLDIDDDINSDDTFEDLNIDEL